MEKIILVTGGSRGIGAATCRLAARQGFAVAVNYRADRAAADSIVSEIRNGGGRAMAVGADVADEQAISAMFEAVVSELGVPTALVNSAGISVHGRVENFDGDALAHLMRVNVVGTMLCCREAARLMSTANGGKGGAIVNVSSMAATIGGRREASAYATSKAAVDAFTVGFAKEVSAEGIRVNALRPGVTMTDMTTALRENPAVMAEIVATIGMKRPAEAAEIAAPILFLLSDEASFVSGATLDVSGGGFLVAGSTGGR
ncbi:SDR family oxidoreductase [Acuticoccus sp. MNP-M23]|uniref:SDR family oxidoreductase n=1 Tax=Acuticoccus sp. MNP-M23 TaxID=3072793 RepID=UPI0028159D6B|nr:SDR family oxidoreductase [Acuticoccus sp. MNP-M23]WMS43551.1 SDR family oxidoreductase [Acuticoccus sp. MNP-M23]